MAEILIHATNIIERPTISIGVILQKQVSSDAWSRSLRRLLDCWPALTDASWIFSDHDAGLTAALRDVLPNVEHILDFNHFLINVKYALRARKLLRYWRQIRDDMIAFMDCEDEVAYQAAKAQRADFWPHLFREYYNAYKEDQVRLVYLSLFIH
jgi:hypothetical protein